MYERGTSTGGPHMGSLWHYLQMLLVRILNLESKRKRRT